MLARTGAAALRDYLAFDQGRTTNRLGAACLDHGRSSVGKGWCRMKINSSNSRHHDERFREMRRPSCCSRQGLEAIAATCARG